MPSHQYQSLLFPQRFWVVNPNLTRRFHQVLRGIALYERRYYVCCPTTTGWCPIVVSRQERGHLWSSPLALHSLEHAVIYHVPNQLSSTVDTHRVFLVSGDVEHLEAIDAPFPSWSWEGPHIGLWYAPMETYLTGWLVCTLEMPGASTILDMQKSHAESDTNLLECSMTVRQEQRKRISVARAVFGFSLSQGTSLALRRTRFTKRGISPLDTICTITYEGQGLLARAGKQDIPVEVQSWPSARRVNLTYARFPGRWEGTVVVRQSTRALELELDPWESGWVSPISPRGDGLSSAAFTIFDDVADPEPALLQHLFHTLTLGERHAPAWCRFERAGDGLAVSPGSVPLAEIDIQRIF